MNFNVKVLLGVGGFIVIAAAAVFLFSSSEEKVIQKLLEGGLKAAEEGNAEGVIALLSPNYRNGDQTYDGIVKRIRQAVSQRITPARMDPPNIQVSGDDADASVRVIIGALQLRQEFGLRLKLKKEGGVWKVTSAEEAGR
ncbi:MAG: nuclear transport factor 2 family protein [Planctomycetes bacterium]|nr:nuclear transport factor 2 family protein [Planctomycetota bacterium]